MRVARVAHARIQGAAVAADVVREDGLPDGGAQAGGRHGAADHVAEYLLEGALDLAEAGEGVTRIVAGGEVHALDVEKVLPVGQEVVVEAPARGIALGRGGPEGRREKMAVVTLIEDVQDRVFIEHQVRRAGLRHLVVQPGLELLNQRLDAFGDAVDVGARLLGLRSRAGFENQPAWDERVPQCGAFEFHPFGQEWVRVGELGDCADDRPARGRGRSLTGGTNVKRFVFALLKRSAAATHILSKF